MLVDGLKTAVTEDGSTLCYDEEGGCLVRVGTCTKRIRHAPPPLHWGGGGT